MKYLSYKKIGKGKPFVLVHGYLGGQHMWRFQEELNNNFELIMPSLAGYGESAQILAQQLGKMLSKYLISLII